LSKKGFISKIFQKKETFKGIFSYIVIVNE
jgi:hypothetical protein